MSKHKIIAILGPTASGKSDLSLKLGENYKLPILNCDSKLFYKGFDIGTAKPTKKERNIVRHYMIDVLEANQTSNLRWFLDKSRKVISDLSRKNIIPIITGGTGQYLWGLIEGWDPPEVKPNEKLREKLNKEIYDLGIDEVVQNYSKIYDLDKNLDLHNPIRLIRIIERIEAGYLEETDRKIKNFIIDPLIIGINIERSKSDQLIMSRIKKMLENGWINEVKSLLDSGIKIDSAPMRSIGYREVAEYIKNNLSKDELEEKIYTSTRKLMRHQDNWFKKSDKRIKWINFSNSFSEADIIIKEWLEN